MTLLTNYCFFNVLLRWGESKFLNAAVSIEPIVPALDNRGIWNNGEM